MTGEKISTKKMRNGKNACLDEPHTYNGDEVTPPFYGRGTLPGNYVRATNNYYETAAPLLYSMLQPTHTHREPGPRHVAQL